MTLRKLLWMAEGRAEFVDRGQWNHTASVIATVRNIMLGKGQRATQPSEVNPYTAGKSAKSSGMTREQFAKSAGLPRVVGKVKKNGQ